MDYKKVNQFVEREAVSYGGPIAPLAGERPPAVLSQQSVHNLLKSGG
jgi:hypothetical protein